MIEQMRPSLTLLRYLLYSHEAAEGDIAARLGISQSCLSRIASRRLKTKKALRLCASYFSEMLNVPLTEADLTTELPILMLVRATREVQTSTKKDVTNAANKS